MERATALKVQNVLNTMPMYILGGMLSEAGRETPLYNQVLFAMSPEFDSQRTKTASKQCDQLKKYYHEEENKRG